MTPICHTSCQSQDAAVAVPKEGKPSVHRAWMLAVLLACGAATTTAHADEDIDRENLARIAHEISRVKLMVAEAAKASDQGHQPQRIKFRYDWLVQDLQMLHDGVTTHVDAPRQPRPVAPLRGDYRQ
jgi:RAQPRD family integrative conjugative element protein